MPDICERAILFHLKPLSWCEVPEAMIVHRAFASPLERELHVISRPYRHYGLFEAVPGVVKENETEERE